MSEQLINTIFLIIQIVAIFFLPQVFVILSKKYKFFKFLSPVILCYLGGIILANLPFFRWDSSLSETLSGVSVPFAIALILFSADIKSWFSLSKTTAKSFILVIVSALVSATVFGLLFANQLPEGWKVTGMLTGCYTGGTPNLQAIGKTLEMAEQNILYVNMSDMFWGGIYFLLITSVLIKLYRKILPPFDKTQAVKDGVKEVIAYEPIFEDGKKQGWKNVAFAVSIAFVIAAVSFGLSMLISKRIDDFLVITLSVTTLSILASFWKKLSNIKGTYAMGQYGVYIFSFAIGGAFDIKRFLSTPEILGFLAITACVMFGAIVLHLILCKIFKVDGDTAIITSVAGVYGPLFITPIAEAMDNKHVILSGLTTGIIGYAVGNYLGIGIAYLVKAFFY